MKIFKKKPTIIALHGFGIRKQIEFENLKNALKKEKYDLVSINLFDEENLNDTDWTAWVARAQQLIKKHSLNNEIVLIGFSMGGVIASYLSNEHNVKKLILLAPAFEYLNINNLFDYVVKPFSKSRKKKSLPPSFTSTFIDVVNNCKESINDNNLPTLIIHCEKDDVIPVSSSQKVLNKIPHDHKALLSISNGQHRILDDEIAGPVAINLILDFIKNKIIF